MADTRKIWSMVISRRALLQGITSAAVAAPVVLATATSALAAKASKASVGYQNHPKGSQHCANCSLFIPPSSCKLVAGTISPNGWCSLWVSK